jgi:TRAP-type C4-dicarboxylate transport system substrate-binding protein
MGRSFNAVVAGLALGLSLGPLAHAQSTWQGYHYVGSAAPTAYTGMEKLAAAIKEETRGAVSIRMNVGGSLPIQAASITQAVGDGLVHIAADGFMTGNVPITGVLRLPMLLTSEEEFAKASAALMPDIERAYLKKGVVVLAQYVYPLQVAWSSRKLTSVEDMAGQKMRVTSPEQSEFVKLLGGTAITIGAPEVPSALASGLVNGAFTASSGGGRLWKDQLKYNFRFGPNYFNSFIIVNKDTWDRLSDENRKVIKAAAQRAAQQITADMKAEEADLTRQLAGAGMVVTEATPDVFAQAAKKMPPIWDDWAAKHDAESRKALADVRSIVGR